MKTMILSTNVDTSKPPSEFVLCRLTAINRSLASSSVSSSVIRVVNTLTSFGATPRVTPTTLAKCCWVRLDMPSVAGIANPLSNTKVSAKTQTAILRKLWYRLFSIDFIMIIISLRAHSQTHRYEARPNENMKHLFYMRWVQRFVDML